MRLDRRILKTIFPSIVIKTSDSGIHLTFDDGPHPVTTPSILNILRARNIHASFFLLGRNCRQYPDLVRQIMSEGHTIGNHSYAHTNLFFSTMPSCKDEILKTENIIEAVTGKDTRLFRPPFGYFTPALLTLLKELGFSCVLWTVDSKDYRLQNPQKIQRRILGDISAGSILLFHDNDATVDTHRTYLPPLLDQLMDRGFTFTRLPL